VPYLDGGGKLRVFYLQISGTDKPLCSGSRGTAFIRFQSDAFVVFLLKLGDAK